MKNTIILFAISFTAIASFYYLFGCNDKPTTPTLNNCSADTSITYTDEFGNFLGGDTTDWCLHDSGGVKFGPVFPNPTGNIVYVRFDIPAIDTIAIYMLKTCTDTTTYYKGPVNRGQYEIEIYDTNNQYKNTYQRLYFKSKHYSSSQYCRFYGDIKFTE